MKFILVYITNPSKKSAEQTAAFLLNESLIACGNIFPINSIYKWKNAVQSEKEYVLIAKTLESNYDQIMEAIKEVHPYEIPCVIKVEAQANDSFLGWVKEEIGLNNGASHN
jgi:periplasmic divalent cation tolerance protein